MMKITKKFTFILLVLAGISSASFGQDQYEPHSEGDVNKIKNGVLAVVLKEFNAKKYSKLKPAKAEDYKKSIEEYNVNIRQVVDSLWHYSKEIVYISEEESKQLIKKRDEKYCLLNFGTHIRYSHGYGGKVNTHFEQVIQVLSAAHPRSALIVYPTPDNPSSKETLRYLLLNLIDQIKSYY